MFDEIKSGDLIAVSGKGLCSGIIQAGTLSLPNMGPLGRWGWAGASHVAVAASVYSSRYHGRELIVYESTSFDRPPCYSSGRSNPKGVQSHRLSDILNAGGDVFHFPLRRPLYDDEEIRLIKLAESAIGRGYDFFGAGKSGGGIVMRLLQRLKGKEDMQYVFCSELALWLWIQIGIAQNKHAGMSPTWLIRWARRRGIIERGRRLS